MPKYVDHEQRRAEIVHALWRVVATDGLEAASVRSIAAEAGWSLGAIRHYFRTQDELIRFGAQAMLDSANHRVSAILQARRPGPRRCQQLMEQLLPLDDERMGEVRVWLALLLRSAVDPALDELRLSSFRQSRDLARLVVTELGSRPYRGRGRPLPATQEALATGLQAAMDGLALQAATVPELMPPPVVTAACRRELSAVRASLTRTDRTAG